MDAQWVAAGILLGMVGITIVFLVSNWYTSSAQRRLEKAMGVALSNELPPGIGTHLTRRPTVRGVDVIGNSDEGAPEYVPIVRIDLETTDAPGFDLVFEFVADVLTAIQPVFADEPVRQYDVQFRFGPSGLFVDGECRRVSVPPELAKRLLSDENFRAHDLRRAVERGATDGSKTIDSETVDRERTAQPVRWGECRRYS